MVTTIFGAVGLDDKNIFPGYLRDHGRYGANHIFQIRDIEDGEFGAMLIGEYKDNFQRIPLKATEEQVICGDITIYNRHELVKMLQIPSDSDDMEILVSAIKKWDYRCIEFLTGDFAFVIWNHKKKELFCARDQMGIRPFYYSRLKQGLVFASEINIVKPFLKDHLKLNREFFLDTLVTAISGRSETAFEGIYRLPPAHYMIYSQDQIQIKKYWSLDQDRRIRYNSDEEYGLHFYELLKNAVAIRCRGVQQVGSELSGGLDSTAVTCIASGIAAKENIPFTAFSNTLPENHHTVMTDEREYILKVLEWKPINWHEVNEFTDPIPGLIDHSMAVQGCYTQQRFHIFNRGIYEAAGKSGVSVLLSGFGGDEMVSARTGNAWNDMIREKQWRQLFGALTYKTSPLKALLKGIKRMLKYQLNRNRKPAVTSGIYTPGMLRRRFGNLPLQAQFIKDNQLVERYFHKYENEAALYLSDKLVQKISHPHVSQRLEYSYAAAAYYGIQYRYPLLDTALIQTYLSFPSWIKNRPGTDRYLFRQALQGKIPESIRLRSDKTGAVIPQTYMRLSKDREILKDYFLDKSINPLLNHMFDFSQFERWIDSLLERNPDDMNYLMPGAFYNYLMIITWLDKNSSIL